jgi:uncharacterized membrane protein
MLDTIFGLPIHPLVVHATVVIVPAAAAAVLLAAFVPRFRAWAGYLPLLLSVAAVMLVPISTGSGEALEERLPETPLMEEHTQIAEGLLLPVLVLLVSAAALYWLRRKEIAAQGADDQLGGGSATVSTRNATAAPTRAIVAGILVLAAVGVIGTTVQVARIGHSGAKSAWSGVGQQEVSGSGEAGDE